MALPSCCLPVIKAIIDGMERPSGGAFRALSLGYPDLLASRDQLVAIFGAQIESGLQPRQDSAAVNRWHGTAAMLPAVFETVAFFKAIDVSLDCVDISASRGFERIIDLNEPTPSDMVDAYHLVLDFGTMEHCFNIAQAMTNAANALVEGGCIIHLNPLNMFNHGFYNFNPTFYADFYGQNGFDVLFLSGLTGHIANISMFDVPAVARFREAPNESNLLAVARRTRPQPIVWPKQHKYHSNPALLG